MFVSLIRYFLVYYTTEYLPYIDVEVLAPNLMVSSSNNLWISSLACFTCISDVPSITRCNLRSPGSNFFPGSIYVPLDTIATPSALSHISSNAKRFVTLRRAL